MKNIILSLLIGVAIIGAIAYSNGCIPTPDTLTLIPPTGNIQAEIKADKIAQLEEALDGEDLKSIKYEIYQTNKPIEEVYKEYRSFLEGQGYTEQTSGFKLVEDCPVFYYAFVKGLVGVAFAISIIDEGTYILYSTGNVLDYMEIKDRLESEI